MSSARTRCGVDQSLTVMIGLLGYESLKAEARSDVGLLLHSVVVPYVRS